MALLDRLNALDRRVGRTVQRRTPERWARIASQWWWWLVFSGVFGVCCVDVALTTKSFVDRVSGPYFFALAVGFAFRAARMKAEHDRLTGKDSWAKLRPQMPK